MDHKPGGRLPLLSARLAVTPQPLRGLLPILLLGEQRHNGCEQFAKTVSRQRRDCDLNLGPSVPESSTLTTRLPSDPVGRTKLTTCIYRSTADVSSFDPDDFSYTLSHYMRLPLTVTGSVYSTMRMRQPGAWVRL